jgi:hypothetical protein
MNTQAEPTTPGRRPMRIVVALVLALSIATLLPSLTVAADASPAPGTPAPPAPTLASAEAMCDSVGDLRLIVEFLRATDVEADGWLPVFVGVVAGLGEARDLVGSVGETYRPLLDDLIASLGSARVTVEQVREAETMGAGVAMIGEAITGIGNAMDALSLQLRDPCPIAASPAAETPAA